MCILYYVKNILLLGSWLFVVLWEEIVDWLMNRQWELLAAIYVTQLIKMDQLGRMFPFLNGCSFSSTLKLELDIAFSRYGKFIDDVITDQWKVNFEKKACKIWKSGQSIAYNINSKVHFYMKILVLHQIPQLRKSVLKIWKIHEISKLTLEQYFDFVSP